MTVFNKLFSTLLISFLIIGCSSEQTTSTNVDVASPPKVVKANATPLSTEVVKEEATPITVEYDASTLAEAETKVERIELETTESLEKELDSVKKEAPEKAPKTKKTVLTKQENVKAPRKKGKAKISFEKMTHRYGTISQGEKINYQFKFKNIGTKELEISNVTASCGCTQPSFPFMPILPGEEGFIGVVFDSHGRLGNQKPTITVVTNAKPSTYELHLEGVVDAPENPPSEVKDSL